VRREGGLWWALAADGAKLDPERYLGESGAIVDAALTRWREAAGRARP
jgi:hypothetical protein